MGAYVFRFPADMPELTFDGLKNVTHIGGTVEVIEYTEFLAIRLYATTIARLGRGWVEFPERTDRHQATRMWLEQIVRDNRLGSTVYRNRKGEATIDGEWPIEGRKFVIENPHIPESTDRCLAVASGKHFWDGPECMNCGAVLISTPSDR
jgi:hypothetical protein